MNTWACFIYRKQYMDHISLEVTTYSYVYTNVVTIVTLTSFDSLAVLCDSLNTYSIS
jgi:hypothetical protein